MKKLFLIFFITLSLQTFSNTKNNLLSGIFDFSAIIKESSAGFIIHPKLGVDIWETKIAIGSLSLGTFFSYTGSYSYLKIDKNYESENEDKPWLHFQHRIFFDFSVGHNFSFKNLKLPIDFGIYYFLGLNYFQIGEVDNGLFDSFFHTGLLLNCAIFFKDNIGLNIGFGLDNSNQVLKSKVGLITTVGLSVRVKDTEKKFAERKMNTKKPNIINLSRESAEKYGWKISELNNNDKIDYLNENQKNIAFFINMLRTNPKLFAEIYILKYDPLLYNLVANKNKTNIIDVDLNSAKVLYTENGSDNLLNFIKLLSNNLETIMNESKISLK